MFYQKFPGKDPDGLFVCMWWGSIAGLKKFLKKNCGEKDTLALMDAKLGNIIKEKLGVNCVYSNGVMELCRGVRSQLQGLISQLHSADLQPMSLGLSHSLSRYKLKFSPDKVCLAH